MSEHRRILAIGTASDGLPVDLSECGLCHEEWPCRASLQEALKQAEAKLVNAARLWSRIVADHRVALELPIHLKQEMDAALAAAKEGKRSCDPSCENAPHDWDYGRWF